MMHTQITLHPLMQGPIASGVNLGMRKKAIPLREQIEAALSNGREVSIDFEGVNATQSFIDELIGILVLKHGPEVLANVKFKSCSTDLKAIVQFVVEDRAEQFMSLH